MEKRSVMPTAAGVLSIISGVWGWVACIMMMYLVMSWSGSSSSDPQMPPPGVSYDWMLPLLLPYFIIGVVAIVGGVFALKRKVWGLALAGAICATINGVFYLGIPAIVLLALSKKNNLFR